MTERIAISQADFDAVCRDALRWAYVRDVLWLGVKRGELPESLADYFYNVDDVKYPTRYHLDEAVDYLRVPEVARD